VHWACIWRAAPASSELELLSLYPSGPWTLHVYNKVIGLHGLHCGPKTFPKKKPPAGPQSWVWTHLTEECGLILLKRKEEGQTPVHCSQKWGIPDSWRKGRVPWVGSSNPGNECAPLSSLKIIAGPQLSPCCHHLSFYYNVISKHITTKILCL
jgi:hypothetical protein